MPKVAQNCDKNEITLGGPNSHTSYTKMYNL